MDRISKKIPKDQSAYQAGRSSTEQVLAIKLLLEKAINASEYVVYLALFDMSKAFDNVDREKLFCYLEEILEPDELHILDILTNTPKVQVRVNQELGDAFVTMLGIMQGDCLSATLFIYYLAMTLKNENDLINPNNNFLIKPKYADDTTYLTTSEETHQRTQLKLPTILKENNLVINESKTELYKIPKPPPPEPPPPTIEELLLHKNDKPLWSQLDWVTNFKPAPTKDNTPDWRRCKLLGSYLDTEKDITSRKCRTLLTLRKFEKIFKSNQICRKIKIRTFNIYITCIFLYNSETWSLNKSGEKKIDSFHRRLLRYAIGIQWPDQISNEELKRVTNTEPWSITIRRRRLNLLGHILRLPTETPIQKSIQEAFTPCKNKVGHPKHTWLRTIKEDLARINVNIKLQDIRSINILVNLTQDRDNWRKTIKEVLMQ